MKNAALLTPVLICFLISGCSPGFSTFLKEKTTATAEVGPQVSADGTATIAPDQSDFQDMGPQGGQPGSITLAGPLVRVENEKSKLISQIQVSQVGGKNRLGQLASVKSENRIQLHPQLKLPRLDGVENRSDYLALGCDSSLPVVASLTRGLTPVVINLEAKDSVEVKAKLVIFCGKINLPQAFVSVITGNLVLLDTTYDVGHFNGVGFLSLLTQNLTLSGKNKISARGLDAAGAIADGPTLLLAVQKEFSGKGTLELRTIGGNRLQSGKSK